MNRRQLQFYKMEGAGNDFVVIDNFDNSYSREQLIDLTPDLCHRRFGVGGDGLIALEKPAGEEADYTMFYRNADGSDAGMCGNGARCIALFARERGFGDRHSFTVHDRNYTADITGDDEVEISFPVETSVRRLEDDDGSILYQAYPGTEHIVKEVDESGLADKDRLRVEGSRLRNDVRFQPEGTNVNFIHGTGEEEIVMQTYERGVEDLTLACGTGAIAAALAWHDRRDGSGGPNRYTVKAEGGVLEVSFHYREDRRRYQQLTLKGPAHFVFEGTYNL